MKALRGITIIIAFSTIYSCRNSATDNGKGREGDTAVSKSTVPVALPVEPKEKAQIQNDGKNTTIIFDELSFSIHHLIVDNKSGKHKRLQADSVEIDPALGETIEGKTIVVSAPGLTGLKVEQRYETGVAIMNEGEHCDLTDWKHYYSDWKPLQQEADGKFIASKYTTQEHSRFPAIPIEQLRAAVAAHCGAEWHKRVESVKSPTEYPSGVSISRYDFRITGSKRNNGKVITKLITIRNPMGD